MFRFRDHVDATSGFGILVVEALRSSASWSTARKVGLRKFFLFDNPASLRAFEKGLTDARWHARAFYPQQDNLQWALGQSRTLLLAIRGSEVEILSSDNEQEFDELYARPKRLRRILAEFRYVRSRYTYGNLALGPANPT